MLQRQLEKVTHGKQIVDEGMCISSRKAQLAVYNAFHM